MNTVEREKFISENCERLAACVNNGFFTIFLADRTGHWDYDTNYISVYIIDPRKGVWNMNKFIHEYLGIKVSTSNRHYERLIVCGSIANFVHELLSKLKSEGWHINIDLNNPAEEDRACRFLN